MNDSHDDLILGRILRIVAIVAALAVVAFAIADSGEVGPNFEYNLYALWFVAIATALACGLQFDNLYRILTNLDLAVPAALFVGARACVWHMVSGVQPPGGGLVANIDRIALVAAPASLEFLLKIFFLGWTSRMLLDFVIDGDFSLTGSLRRVREWFPRTLVGVVFGWLIFGVVMAALAGIGLVSAGFVYPVILVLAVATPVVNFMTAGLIPFLLLTEGPALKSAIEGLKFGLRNARLTWLPVLVYMFAAGTFFVASLNYRVVPKPDDDSKFGRTWSSSYSTKNTLAFAVNFDVLALFPMKSDIQSSVVKQVETEASPTVAVRITVLMVILGLCTNLTLIRNLFGDPFGGAVPKPLSAEDKQVFAKAAVFLVVLALPLEPIAAVFLRSSRDGFPDMTNPRVYRGAGFFEVKTLVSGDNLPAVLGNEDDIYSRLESVSFDPTRNAFLVLDGKRAARLDRAGKTLSVVRFDFGPVAARTKNPEFRTVRAVDLDGDGAPEFVGLDRETKTAVVLDSEGRHKWHTTLAEGVTAVLGIAGADGEESKVVAIGSKKTVVFDGNGKKISTLDLATDSLSNFEIYKADRAGGPYIVKRVGLGVLVADVSTGKSRAVGIPVSIAGMLEGDELRTIYFGDNQLGLFDLDGNLRWKSEAPNSSSFRRSAFAGDDDNGLGDGDYVIVTRAFAVPVRFHADAAPFLAVTVSMSVSPMRQILEAQMLYIYDGGGRLVYQESLNGVWESSVLAVPSADGTESLVWTAGNTVRSYTAKTD